MARIMASAMRLSCKQRSTALSKLPVSKAWVIKPSTSAREQCLVRPRQKSHLEMQQLVIQSRSTTLHNFCKAACPTQALRGMLHVHLQSHCGHRMIRCDTAKHHLPCCRARCWYLIGSTFLNNLWNNSPACITGNKVKPQQGLDGFCVTQDLLEVSLLTGRLTRFMPDQVHVFMVTVIPLRVATLQQWGTGVLYTSFPALKRYLQESRDCCAMNGVTEASHDNPS